MNDIRLIALDMDGTLLGSDHATIPPRNIEALRKAHAMGVKVAIASGRCWTLIQEYMDALGVVDYGITSNGGYVLDPASGETLVKFPMDPDQCIAIVDVMRKWGLAYELYIDGQNYVQADEMDGAELFTLSDEFLTMYRRQVQIVPDMKQIIAGRLPEKFDIFYVPPEHKAAIMDDIRKTGPVTFAAGMDTSLELTAVGVDKGRALSALAEKLGLGAENVMACGDANNDLEMLSWAYWSFAMANGTPEAKAAARFETAENFRAGVGLAVEKYVIKGEPPAEG